LSNLKVVRSADGAEFPHVISSVEHIAWGQNMFIRPNPDDSDWSASWNAFFSAGDAFHFEHDTGGGDACDPEGGSGGKFTGYDKGGSFCNKASGALDENRHVAIYSGR
jgi:hypothetical protein